MSETMRKATFMLVCPAIQPIKGGEIASPRAWMMRILRANAVARIRGGDTFASAAFAGPVLKKRKKIAKKTSIHARGNGVSSIRIVVGNARSIAIPEVRK